MSKPKNLVKSEQLAEADASKLLIGGCLILKKFSEECSKNPLKIRRFKDITMPSNNHPSRSMDQGKHFIISTLPSISLSLDFAG